MDEHVIERLSDYLDDEDISAADRARVEQHLAICGDCRSLFDDLREVTVRAAALAQPPVSGADAGDGADGNWAAIAARIDAARPRVAAFTPKPQARRFSFTLPQLVAAGLALMVLSGGSVWLIRHGGERTDFEPISAQAPARETSAAVPVAARVDDGAYDAAIRDLESALETGRSKLDPETVRVLETNLRSIDEAIDQSRRALAADPASVYLNIHIADAKKRKLALLRRAAALAATRS